MYTHADHNLFDFVVTCRASCSNAGVDQAGTHGQECHCDCTPTLPKTPRELLAKQAVVHSYNMDVMMMYTAMHGHVLVCELQTHYVRNYIQTGVAKILDKPTQVGDICITMWHGC